MSILYFHYIVDWATRILLILCNVSCPAQTGSDLQNVSAAPLTATKFVAVLIESGVVFHSLAASIWKLHFDF